MDWKLRPVAALEETSFGKAQVSPSKTVWPAPGTLLLSVVGTSPCPQHHHPCPQESAQWLLLISFLSKHSLASSLNHFQDTKIRAQREPLLGVQGLPTGSLPGRWSRGWLEPNKGRTHGFVTWDLPPSGSCCWRVFWAWPSLRHLFLLALGFFGFPCF